MKHKTIRLALLLLLIVPFTLAADGGRKTWLVGTNGPTELRESTDGLPGIVRGRFHRFDVVALDLTDEEARALSRSPRIRYIEPVVERHALELSRKRSASPAAAAEGTISASGGSQQIPYGIDLVQAPPLWPITRGQAVKLAIIDTGIDREHPDLQNCYKGGYDFVNGDDDPQDDNGHGTHVAGTIAAADNDFGVVGVAPMVEIYSLKVLDADGNGSNLSLLQAVQWAIDNHMDVISMSLGGEDSSASEMSAFQRARDAGIIAVAAAGNAYDTNPVDGIDYPANYPSVVSVGAIDSDSLVASFSQRGANLDVSAPGVGVLSTYFLGSAYTVSFGPGDSFLGVPLEYSPLTATVSGKLVDCGLGKTASDFPAAVAGNVALIQRGDISFKEKATRAAAAGATAVMIYNNQPGDFSGTLCTADPNQPCTGAAVPPNPILTISLSQEDGQSLKTRAGQTVTLSLGSVSDYGTLNGTSMATPHVSGVIALLISVDPDGTPQQIIDALEQTAVDLGDPGRDTVYGFGLVNAYGAARMLAPQRFVSTGGPRRHAVRRPGSH